MAFFGKSLLSFSLEELGNTKIKITPIITNTNITIGIEYIMHLCLNGGSGAFFVCSTN